MPGRPGIHGQPESEFPSKSLPAPNWSRRSPVLRPAAATSSSASATSAWIPTSTAARPVFNRTAGLRDTWAKIEKRAEKMIILGIGGIQGDPATAILKDGELVAAIEESKLARRRTQWGGAGEMPGQSIAACLKLAGATAEQVDAVALVRPLPEADFHLKVRASFPASRMVVVEHHRAHAASAYYPSPFEEGHRAHARSRQRLSLRRTLARARHRPGARIGNLCARFARRTLRPRDRTAGLPGATRRAQAPVVFRVRRRPVSRISSWI